MRQDAPDSKAGFCRFRASLWKARSGSCWSGSGPEVTERRISCVDRGVPNRASGVRSSPKGKESTVQGPGPGGADAQRCEQHVLQKPQRGPPGERAGLSQAPGLGFATQAAPYKEGKGYARPSPAGEILARVPGCFLHPSISQSSPPPPPCPSPSGPSSCSLGIWAQTKLSLKVLL